MPVDPASGLPSGDQKEVDYGVLVSTWPPAAFERHHDPPRRRINREHPRATEVKIVTITSHQVSLPVDEPAVDQRPGSNDVA